jgi:hypothetical protein
MNTSTRLSRLSVALAVLVWPLGPGIGAAQSYIGSEACATCHLDQYNTFRVSGHPFKLTPAAEAQYRPIPLPEGYWWDDISYVIGGYKWKSRYLGTNGYILTVTGTGGNGTNQYNNMTGKWSNYNAGAVKKYDCGPCHTTGYSSAGNQDGLPGIVGTWAAPGIQCEACHGPGEVHANSSGAIPPVVDTRSSACGQCHIRGASNAIPAKPEGYIDHHEQYNELLASPHDFLECVDCHNPHKKAEFSIQKTCAECHDELAAAYAKTAKAQRGVKCEDCHLPKAGLSAQPLGPHKGDVMTHLFAINTDPAAKLFTDDGKFVRLDANGKAGVTLDFACLQCHTDIEQKKGLDVALRWAAAKAKRFHSTKVGGGLKR